MKIKNLKFNKRLAALALLVSLGVTGCAKKSNCDVKEYHLHRYEKEGVVRYIDSEKLTFEGYNWTDVIEYTDKEDKKLHEFETKKDLLRIEDNVDYIKEQQEKHEDYIEYRYAYTYLLPIPHIISTGKSTITFFTYIPTTHYSWTADPNHPRLTGEERLCHYVYNGYKIEKDEHGKYVLIPSEDVEDVLTVKDEFPYMKEKFYKVVQLPSNQEVDYEDGANDDEKNIVPQEEEDQYEEGKEYKKAR